MANINQGNSTETFSALDEENVEAASALAYIADVFESDPDGAFAKTLGHWRQWLGDEGYIADSVEQVIRKVVAEQLDSTNQLLLLEKMIPDISVNEAVSRINSHAPGLVDALLGHVTHGANLHAALLGVSGGKGKNNLNASNPPSLDKVAKHLKNELAYQGEIESITEAKGKTIIETLNVNDSPLRKEAVNFNQGDKGTKVDKLIEEFAVANISVKTLKGNDKLSRALQGVQDVLRDFPREGRRLEQTALSRAVDDLRAALDRPKPNEGPMEAIITPQEAIKTIENASGNDNLSRALQSVQDVLRESRMDGPSGERNQAEIAKVRFIENTIAELREERQQMKAVIENIENTILTDPKKVAELLMKNLEENPFEIDSLKGGTFLRKERGVIQRFFTGGTAPEPTRKDKIEGDIKALETAFREYPEKALKALIVERVENPTPDNPDQQLLNRVEDRMAEQVVDRFIEDIIEIRQQKSEQEEMILKDIEKAILTDPKKVAELVMKNLEENPFEIDSLIEGRFIKIERKERINQTIHEIERRISGGPAVEPTKIDEIEGDIKALETAFQKYPEEALQALIADLNNDQKLDTVKQKLLDPMLDSLAEKEVERFVDEMIKNLTDHPNYSGGWYSREEALETIEIARSILIKLGENSDVAEQLKEVEKILVNTSRLYDDLEQSLFQMNAILAKEKKVIENVKRDAESLNLVEIKNTITSMESIRSHIVANGEAKEVFNLLKDLEIVQRKFTRQYEDIENEMYYIRDEKSDAKAEFKKLILGETVTTNPGVSETDTPPSQAAASTVA